MLTRRQLLQAGLLLTGSAAWPGCRLAPSVPPPLPPDLPRTTPWPEANAILAATSLPIFAETRFAVTDFGAVGDGRHDDTTAFLAAIAACHQAGGGHVTVPDGAWRVGALRLRSHVDLNLAAGATLLFSGDARQYPIVRTRYEGIECMNHSPMVYAFGEESVALTGRGTLDASATAEWNRGGDRELLESLVARGVPPEERRVAGRLRVAFVEPHASRRVLISGVRLLGTRFWQLHPTLCTDVTIEGVTTTAAPFAGTDGCDPESCDQVVIRSSTLAAGDDNIALKSGRDDDGRRVNVPCQNVVILNCQGEGPYAFLACGSEQTGGIQHVYAYNNWTYGHGVAAALRIKTNPRRGGFTRNVNVDTFRGTGFSDAVIDVTLSYGGKAGAHPPSVSDLDLSRFDVAGAPYVLRLSGLPNHPIAGVRIRDSRFSDIHSPQPRTGDTLDVAWSNVTINGHPVRG
jgi:polygalacturonase